MLDVVERGLAADWSVEEISKDKSWIFPLTPSEALALIEGVRQGRVEGRDLLEYSPEDFDLGPGLKLISRAFLEAQNGRGIALVRGLPRDGVSEEEFALMTWAIGLAIGVARPQGRASQYLSEVRNAGGVYRSPTGRGYSSNAELDFHVDGGDLVALTCYNVARAGGASRVASSVRAYEVMRAERPDLLEALFEPFVFNLQGEEQEGEAPTMSRPIYAVKDGKPFCNWNRNRIEAAQTREDVPRLTSRQIEAVDLLDDVIRRPDVMFEMKLEPGDMQILNNHTALHSRTLFEDYDEPERKRLLYRLWLNPRDNEALPESLLSFFPSAEGNIVRGGTNGHHYDALRQSFEARLAKYHGLRPPLDPADRLNGRV